MKIAIIHEVSYLNKPVYEYQDFAERLASLGHQVTVIDFDENNHAPFTRKKISKTGLASVELFSIPHLRIPIMGILLARFHFKIKFKALLQKQSFDAVLLYSVFINGTSTVDLCNQFGIPVIYRLIDAYHRLRSHPLESWILRWGEIKIYRKASAILATNLQMKHYVDQLAGPNHAQCFILDHGVDTNHFQALLPSEKLQKSLGINQDSMVGIFLGTTYSFSRLDQLIAQIIKIRKVAPNFVLLIVGGGELDDRIKKAIATHDAHEYVIACGMIDYVHLPQYLSLASLALCPFEVNDITREIIPIKILQYLSSSLPVVCTPLPDVMNHFPEGKSGAFYSQNDGLESYVNCLIQTLGDKGIKEAGVRARDFVQKQYSIHATIARLEAFLANHRGSQSRNRQKI